MMDASVQTDPVCIIDKDEEKKTYPVNTVALKLDHAYSSKKPSQPQTCSTPRKRKRFSVEPLPALPLDGSGCDTSLEECLSPIEDLAISKEMSPDDLEHSDDFEEIYDPKDETYEQCSEEKSELEDSTFTTPSTSTSFVDERKFIVFESCLQSLCRRVRCSECDSPADEVKLTVCGSACQVKVLCIMGHMSLSWNSQPVSGKMPLGNLLLAGSVLFSGETFGRVDHMFSLINLQFIGATTYNDMQKNHLIPAVHQAWVQEKEAVRTELAGKPVLLGGDGRCDSPGFSAKYCSYTLMDQTTDKILTLQLVQVTETGSSSKMEVLGYERAMDEVLEAGYDVKVCATDRHVQVRKLHKDKYLPLGIQHEFDVYHLANTIRKKLRAKAKTKKYEKLMPWIKSVVHHLWFCAATCEKDPNILVARWQSVTNHVKNVHNFPDNALFPTCAHGPLSDDDARKKRWLTDDSPPYRALVEVVTNPRLVKDIRQLAQFCHTGMLEVYHSLLLKYAPKRQEFDYVPMQARLELAAMDHNANVNRQQARVKYPKAGTAQKGQLRYHTRWSKATERWVVVPVKEAKSYNFVADLLESVVDAKEKNQPFPPVNPPANLARNIAKTPMPCSKEQLILRKMSRF